jgi:hypothetical protein
MDKDRAVAAQVLGRLGGTRARKKRSADRILASIVQMLRSAAATVTARVGQMLGHVLPTNR